MVVCNRIRAIGFTHPNGIRSSRLGWHTQVLACGKFGLADELEHRLARNAEHRDREAAPHVVAVVRVRVVDDVAAGLPERFSGSDDSRWLALEFE
jgi:hypothetical protein